MNLAGDHPEIVERLSKALTELRERSLEYRLPQDHETAESLSTEELERLRSLGYIQ